MQYVLVRLHISPFSGDEPNQSPGSSTELVDSSRSPGKLKTASQDWAFPERIVTQVIVSSELPIGNTKKRRSFSTRLHSKFEKRKRSLLRRQFRRSHTICGHIRCPVCRIKDQPGIPSQSSSPVSIAFSKLSSC